MKIRKAFACDSEFAEKIDVLHVYWSYPLESFTQHVCLLQIDFLNMKCFIRDLYLLKDCIEIV